MAKHKVRQSSYKPAGWGMMFGVLVALLIGIFLLVWAPNYISDRMRYFEGRHQQMIEEELY